jgi:hypothetical protein
VFRLIVGLLGCCLSVILLAGGAAAIRVIRLEPSALRLLNDAGLIAAPLIMVCCAVWFSEPFGDDPNDQHGGGDGGGPPPLGHEFPLISDDW